MQEPPREALGSGFVINAEQGYIVTNAHVVRMAGHDADEIMIKLNGEENAKGHPAKIVGADEVSDVALLKLSQPVAGLKALTFGDSDKARVGEWVLAIGNPYGHSHSVTQGIVSALGRSLEGARTGFMQTSASINPGNSGGPLINVDGQVIGINSAIDPRAQLIGFAIPINEAKTVIQQLVEKGKVSRPWMGIAIQDVSEDVAGLMKLDKPEGVLVKEVMPGQPAAEAGLQAYDVIVKMNGQTVANSHDLFRNIDRLQSGATAEVEVLRDHRPKKVKVRLSEQPVNS
jgi:serine protease Do